MKIGAIEILLLVTILAMGCKNVPQTTGEVIVLIDQRRAEKRYDDALRVGREWLDSNPNDGMIHAYIALVYLQKARAVQEGSAKNAMIESAVDESYKAIELEPKDLTAMRFAFTAPENAADVSENQRCQRYGNAVRVIASMEKSLPELVDEGDLTKSRAFLEAANVRIRQKAAQYGCPAQG
jgi:hypothetical protein